MGQGIHDIAHTNQPLLNEVPTVSHYFNQTRQQFKLSSQYTYSRFLHLGASLNYFSLNMDTYSAATFDFDLGLIYKWRRWTASAQVKNVLASPMKYKNSDDSTYSGEELLPRWYLLGLQYRWRDLRLMTQVSKVPHHTLLAGGVHYHPKFLSILSFY